MKRDTYKRYIVWGVTVFTVIALSIILFFLVFRAEGLGLAFKGLLRILTPILYGIVFAYVINPVYRGIETRLTPRLIPRLKKEKNAVMIARVTGTLVCLIIVFLALWGVYRLIPQVVSSLFGIVQKMPGYVDDLELYVRRLVEENDAIGPVALEMYQGVTDYLENWLRTELLPVLSNWLGIVSGSIMTVVRLLLNLFIGIIVMVYLLNGKHTFSAQGKKIIYSLFPIERANLMIDNIRYAHHVFGGFISGKIFDSAIIGAICFVFMMVADFPYAMLISVIIGVTNVIPFFGPFLGAIPSAILLLFESPILCLYFVIFIIILQQIDGNIIGPKILGNTTGLPSFWVLFSILLFGGLFGFVGMVLAVPVAALCYSTVAALVNRRLYRHDMPTETEQYRDLHHVEPEDHVFIKAQRYVKKREKVTSLRIEAKPKKIFKRGEKEEREQTEDEKPPQE